MKSVDSSIAALKNKSVIEAIKRELIEVDKGRVTYYLNKKKSYSWSDPEEWVRIRTIAFLIIEKGYPANRILTEVKVPRRTPHDFADIVVYIDDKCKEPYLVIENKAAGQNKKDKDQGIEQAFGNANSLRAPFALYDENLKSYFYDVENFAPMERDENLLGSKEAIPDQYGNAPEFIYIAGSENDIKAVKSSILENKIRRAHSIIWAGGRRDPLTAFDEWSKLLFAKVMDERGTPTGEPRRFQVGTNETIAAVATRIHRLFEDGYKDDPTIFARNARINLTDKKIFDVTKTIHDVSFTRTDVDSIGSAFENFFGSVFRGELGQYFTMRQLTRFTIAMLDITHKDFVLDPTAGSGGFLLEALLQVWHSVDLKFKGQTISEIERIKTDFALHRVYGIEIHEILARICKINLLLHHDGHANIEANRSCLDLTFSLPRLNPPKDVFTKIVGNPPFGDEVNEGDEDHLGENSLSNFIIANGRSKLASEHVILERCIDLLEPGGELGLIIPDGLLNNQGEQSNCPQLRRFLAKSGFIKAIVSLPDYAFRKSGAQNKTSVLFFKKYEQDEKDIFDTTFNVALQEGLSEADAIASAFDGNDYQVFLAEADFIGYTATAAPSDKNDLYKSAVNGQLAKDQGGTILGEFRKFLSDPSRYEGTKSPDCMKIDFTKLWNAHESRRLDPKYHLFKREEQNDIPEGWIKKPLKEVMVRREKQIRPETNPDEQVLVMTISQTGEIRPREAGKGNNPPEWLGMYFADSSSKWFIAHEADVVFSSIDLWKGCISVVPKEFDGAIVTKEFPIYRIINNQIEPEFISCLLRSRYYQRAFRAITTGHSNRRRTQVKDFESLEICFPPDKEVQNRLISGINSARIEQRFSSERLKKELNMFSDLIDGKGDYALPEIEISEIDES